MVSRSLRNILLVLVLGIQSIASISLDPNSTALLIIDVQNDFCAGGSCAVPHADDVIPVINDLRSKVNFSKVFLTMDWHPAGHVSFYERFSDEREHPGAKLFGDYKFDLGDGKGQRTQRLWPVHCVQNSTGAALRIGLQVLPTDVVVFKGTDLNVDSYSGFAANDGQHETELDSELKSAGIKSIVVTGLVFEFCVGSTALDGVKRGYDVTVLTDGVGFLSNGDTVTMQQKLRNAGVKVISSEQLNNGGKRALTFRILIICLSAIVFFNSKKQ